MRQSSSKLKRGEFFLLPYGIFCMKQKATDVHELEKTHAKIRSFSMAYCKLICFLQISLAGRLIKFYLNVGKIAFK